MNKFIECLKLIELGCLKLEISKKLDLTEFKTLELIGKINNALDGIVKTSATDRFFLTRKIDWLNLEKVRAYLKQLEREQYNLIILDEVDSTNDYIITNLDKLVTNTVVSSETQIKGRGRGHKVWSSKIGVDLTSSFLYWLPTESDFEVLPLVVAVAINRLFKDLSVKSFIKWPNDIMLEDKTKIAGILVESGIRNDKRFIVIGVGINNILGTDRNWLLAELINNLENVLSEFTFFGFDLIKREWLDNCIHLNKMVKMYRDEVLLIGGKHVNINEQGHLLIEFDRKIYEFGNSNISLRF